MNNIYQDFCLQEWAQSCTGLACRGLDTAQEGKSPVRHKTFNVIHPSPELNTNIYNWENILVCVLSYFMQCFPLSFRWRDSIGQDSESCRGGCQRCPSSNRASWHPSTWQPLPRCGGALCYCGDGSTSMCLQHPSPRPQRWAMHKILKVVLVNNFKEMTISPLLSISQVPRAGWWRLGGNRQWAQLLPQLIPGDCGNQPGLTGKKQ